MRFASLGSGSRGNATLIEGGGTRLLVDCGYSAREFEARCAELGVAAGDIDALLVTHEHGDHIRGVGALARKYGMPVWMTHGTFRNARCGDIPDLRLFGIHTPPFVIGNLEVTPYAVPHDAREPSQFTFRHRECRFGMLTDAGSVTAHMIEVLGAMDALLLECNHDPQMLYNGPYPPRLQARVGGAYGHLSNLQAAALLAAIGEQKLQHLVLAHLSEKNNHPELAEAAVVGRCPGVGERLSILQQQHCSGWFEIKDP
ncbi:MAG TPA: MBL fold metallo-hydrolase [Chromatiaceae bacterium]|nr:MBL fold metallo-hydrolase [Chromatiaceae bacterium]